MKTREEIKEAFVILSIIEQSNGATAETRVIMHALAWILDTPTTLSAALNIFEQQLLHRYGRAYEQAKWDGMQQLDANINAMATR